ncbi:MAG: prepilin-type N-terminal cleavage/methylation domain-containing protein [Bdellovibrionales bacterium]|jgi:prepilin-type N-terminal cleavage/methylation domain-containing protein|nr:prepilin-type N-terminal cleavage/methylation domain-containing protein [Bdellovibrionales bacterium]
MKLPKICLRAGNRSKQGFALIEVMIAIFLFAVFFAVYATSNGFNIASSEQLKEEILLRQLGQNKINEIIESPPEEFTKSLTLGPGKTEEVKGYENYTTTVIYKEMLLPDYRKMKGLDSEESTEQGDYNQFEEKVYDKVKENMEKLIWQVEVTVKNKLTDAKYSISTWLYNQKAKVDVKNF